MNILVLGGCGIQGRGALYDLSKNDQVRQIICADVHPEILYELDYVDLKKIKGVKLDARNTKELVSLMKQDIDVVIELLPKQFLVPVAEAAIEAGVSLVNTNYAYRITHLHESAKAKGIAIMPECGFDPGVDLVIYGYGLKQFDEIQTLNSYCGGVPEKKACDNPLQYKISWNWDAVLQSQKRDSTCIKEGEIIRIPYVIQHDNAYIHQVDFPGIGRLEALPNGDALHFTDLLGVTETIVETGRYSLRWPGWCDFWRPLKHFGFLSDKPVPGLPCEVTPYQFLVNLMEPQMPYRDDEKDLALMQNIFIGREDGKQKKLTFTICLERDLATGIMGMSQGVSYPACIVAQMIAAKTISKKGILSPVTDIPHELFLNELKHRDIKLEETVEYLDKRAQHCSEL
jgi:saccharopine dehydrogenase-like NADP-dependent oxidoreductase